VSLPSPQPGFFQAVDEFNRQDYFDCHETIETFWRPMAPGPEKEFYQGILQVGVGLYHLLRANPRGAQNVLANGLERLQPLLGQAPFEAWMALTPFYEQARQILAALPGLSPEAMRAFPVAQLPRIALKPPFDWPSA
jgi:hypothetical protein